MVEEMGQRGDVWAWCPDLNLVAVLQPFLMGCAWQHKLRKQDLKCVCEGLFLSGAGNKVFRAAEPVIVDPRCPSIFAPEMFLVFQHLDWVLICHWSVKIEELWWISSFCRCWMGHFCFSLWLFLQFGLPLTGLTVSVVFIYWITDAFVSLFYKVSCNWDKLPEKNSVVSTVYTLFLECFSPLCAVSCWKVWCHQWS